MLDPESLPQLLDAAIWGVAQSVFALSEIEQIDQCFTRSRGSVDSKNFSRAVHGEFWRGQTRG